MLRRMPLMLPAVWLWASAGCGVSDTTTHVSPAGKPSAPRLEAPADTPTPTAPDATQTAQAAAKAGAPAPATVELKQVDLAGLEKTLVSFRGQYVAVDAWATWCLPCKEKFPKFVELSKRHAKHPVVFVSMAIEEDDPEKAKAFLTQQSATFTNLLVDAKAQDVQEKYKFTGVPRYFLFDPEGKIAVNSSEFEDLVKKLAEVLKSS